MSEIDDAAEVVTEQVAAAVIAAPASRPAEISPDTPDGACTNCGTPLEGSVCHECGQVADVFHRPVLSLIREGLEGLFSLDGRFVQTVPGLMVFPGHVTRDYLAGKRARFIPPFRLYILASILLFALVPLLFGPINVAAPVANPQDMAELRMELEALSERDSLTEDQRVELADAMAALNRLEEGDLSAVVDLAEVSDRLELAGDRASAGPTADPETGPAPEEEEAEESASSGPGALGRRTGEQSGVVVSTEIQSLIAEQAGEGAAAADDAPDTVRNTFIRQAQRVSENPEEWVKETIAWVPRIMFVMVPIFALLLGLAFVWRRGFFFFDHLIVSLHFHAAFFIAMVLGTMAAQLIGWGWVSLALIVYANFYLYRLLRRVYQRGRFTSLLRLLFLDAVYGIVLSIGLVMVMLAGFMSV
ncbi:MAG: DUF3667 domain-containing protein [Pseudomonadota bacterium]